MAECVRFEEMVVWELKNDDCRINSLEWIYSIALIQVLSIFSYSTNILLLFKRSRAE